MRTLKNSYSYISVLKITVGVYLTCLHSFQKTGKASSTILIVREWYPFQNVYDWLNRK